MPDEYLHIRWMIRRDIPDVVELETIHNPGPWNEDEIIRHLRQRNCIGMVCESTEKIVGWMCYELFKRHLEILRFAYSSPAAGQRMMEKLKNKLFINHRRALAFDMRETDLAGLQFFKAEGFRAIQLLRDHFEEPAEDGIRMHFAGFTQDAPDDMQSESASKETP